MAKEVPFSKEAEESVIGALLIDGEVMNDIVVLTDSTDFYSEQCRFIYQACLDLYKRGEAIDQITVAQELADKKMLKDIGGVSYLSQLISQVPTSTMGISYARIVKNTSIRRKSIQMGHKIQELGYEEKEPVKLVGEIEKLVLDLQKDVALPKLITPIELAKRGELRYTELRQGKRRGIYSGFSSLDHLIGGFYGGEIIYIAARPGVGKTELLLSMAKHAGATSGNILLASLEQTWGEILDRLVSRQILKTAKVIRAGNYPDETYNSIIMELGNVAESNMYFFDSGGDIDTGGGSTQSIYSIAMHMKLAYGLSAVFIDYLGLIEDEVRGSQYERITLISRKLKKLARNLDVPVIVACQLNRELEQTDDKMPQLHHLRDSGALEQDADVILFPYREDKYADLREKAIQEGNDITGKAALIIAKCRQVGEVTDISVPIQWDQQRHCYVNYGEVRQVSEVFR